MSENWLAMSGDPGRGVVVTLGGAEGHLGRVVLIHDAP